MKEEMQEINYKIRFDGRPISYYQDFRCFLEVLPTDRYFEIKRFSESNSLVGFVAEGYGGTPYGNGSIAVLYEDLPDYIKVIVKRKFHTEIARYLDSKERESLIKKINEIMDTDILAVKIFVNQYKSS